MLALNTLRLATVLTHLSKCYNHKCNHLCDTMWNLWASLCKKILLDNSPLTLYCKTLYKLSSCWSHARCRNLSVSIPEQLFFWQPSEHMCLREITHAFYIDKSAAFRVLLFYPKAIIWTYVLSWDYSRTQHWWSAGANLQMGLLFSPTHDNNGFIILSQHIFIHSIASLSCEPTKSTWL